MKPKFISALYCEGRILLFEEYGDVYEFDARTLEWRILASSPWPNNLGSRPTHSPLRLSRTEGK